MSFNLFLNKVKPKISNEKILRLSKARISRSSGCCPRTVPDSKRDFKNFMTPEQKNIMKFNEI